MVSHLYSSVSSLHLAHCAVRLVDVPHMRESTWRNLLPIQMPLPVLHGSHRCGCQIRSEREHACLEQCFPAEHVQTHYLTRCY